MLYIMIDTLELYTDIKEDDFESFFSLIDKAARNISNNRQPLHKSKKNFYKTAAFHNKGFLEIALQLDKKFKKNKIRLKLKPIRLLFPKANIKLSDYDDFEEISYNFQKFLRSIFNDDISKLPPNLGEWKVTRIDYAINIQTQFINEYIKLFHLGFLPKACKIPSKYETSYYLKSKEYNVNFYNKLSQLRETINISYDDIMDEIGFLPNGILRMEVQCKSKYIYRFIEKMGISSTHLKYLWNKELAKTILRKITERLIGTEDIYSISVSLDKLRKNHKYPFCMNCYRLMRLFVLNFNTSLEEIKKSFTLQSDLKSWRKLIGKIQKEGINPIPLDAIMDLKKYGEDFILENPYNLIRFQ